MPAVRGMRSRASARGWLLCAGLCARRAVWAVRQAVMYFRRALALDRSCLSAWTLMGHEYVEMKNPPAAIGALAVCGLCSAALWAVPDSLSEALHHPVKAIDDPSIYLRRASS